MAPPLPPAVEAPIEWWDDVDPALACYRAGSGPAVLLVHSVNAAASSIEMKPLFEALVPRHEIWAVDLPGFGHSAKPKRRYDVALFTEAIHTALSKIGRPTHVVALSLSAEFAARAASDRARDVESLCLITPTGFSKGAEKLIEPGSTRELPGFEAFFSVGLWSRGIFDLLTSKASIRYFLRRTFGSKDVPEEMVEYDWLSARQAGAQHAPYAFLSGKLFSKDIRAVYERLSCPVFLAHGTKGDFSDYSEVQWAEGQDNWQVQAYDAGALVHYDQPRFAAELEAFIDGGHEALRKSARFG
jgi:pimeloyl-ACP methyl ester carboxylesterase